MKTRIVATVVLVAVFLLLSGTEAFWWFAKVEWGSAWAMWSGGHSALATVCLWALIHGVLSMISGAVVCFWDHAKQPVDEGSLLLLGAVLAPFLLVTDIASGYWPLVERGRYIPLAWGAFVQGFLGIYCIAVWLPRPHSPSFVQEEKVYG